MTHFGEEVKNVIAEFEKKYTEFFHDEFGDDPDKFWAGLDDAGRKKFWVEWCHGGNAMTFRNLVNLWCEQFPIPHDAKQNAYSLLDRYVWGHPEFLKIIRACNARRQELQKQIFIDGVGFTASRAAVVDDLFEPNEITSQLGLNPYANPLLYWFDDCLIVESQPAKVRAFIAQVWDTSKPDAFGDYHKKDIYVQKVEKGDPAFAAIVEAYAVAIDGIVEEQKMFKQLAG